MILYSSITMRDLIRNYKMILAGKNRDSDSDTESQPLVSSSCSSTTSFGSLSDSGVYKKERCFTEKEKGYSSIKSKNSSPSLACKKHGNHRQQPYFPPNFDPPELDVYTANENVYDNFYDQNRHYSKINGLIDNSINFEPSGIRKDSPSGYESFPFPDYRDEEKPTHNSLITIFAVWNTTMGSSLLAMSWGLEKSGLFSGILINIIIAAICLYTAYVLLKINEKHSMPGQDLEVCDLCKMLIGKWAEILAKIFSIVVLIGANIVYWILMSNFLYNSLYFIHGFFTTRDLDPNENSTVICLKQNPLTQNETQLILSQIYTPISLFDKVWDLHSTVPIYLAIVMFPLLNFKSPTFFTKFNSLGTVSVGYLLLFVALKSANWGVNIPDWSAEIQLKPTFCALSGMLSLSYFIHNIIISVMRNNKHQEHNGRDLSIAFGLITFTYLFIGVVFYVCFPMAKSCIEDNILNNFSKRDTMTIIARVLLMFQLFTVFPLISFMLRNDILTNVNLIFKNYRFGDFTYRRVLFLNAVVVFVCIMFACFLPRIGTLIRYTGALSGLVYVFMLPNLLKIASLRKERNLTTPKLIFHVFIIVLGVLNLGSQFFISE